MIAPSSPRRRESTANSGRRPGGAIQINPSTSKKITRFHRIRPQKRQCPGPIPAAKGPPDVEIFAPRILRLLGLLQGLAARGASERLVDVKPPEPAVLLEPGGQGLEASGKEMKRNLPNSLTAPFTGGGGPTLTRQLHPKALPLVGPQNSPTESAWAPVSPIWLFSRSRPHKLLLTFRASPRAWRRGIGQGSLGVLGSAWKFLDKKIWLRKKIIKLDTVTLQWQLLNI